MKSDFFDYSRYREQSDDKLMPRLFNCLLISIFFIPFSINVLSANLSEFSEKDYLAVLASAKNDVHSKVVIYSWSPHMVLSQKGLGELTGLERELKFRLVVVLDPDSNYELAKQMAVKNKWPSSYLNRMKAESLLRMGFKTHFPSYIFLHGSRMSPLVPGYKTRSQFFDLAKDYL